MPNLSVKDVPEALAERLRQRAARNHRSLQGELMAIIEQAANEVPAPGVGADGAPSPSTVGSWDPLRRGMVVGHDARGAPVIRRGNKTVEQIASELRARFPDALTQGPSSVDMIREDRDSR